MNKFRSIFIGIMSMWICASSFITPKSSTYVPQDKTEKIKTLKDGILYQTINPNETINSEILEGSEPATNLVIKFKDYIFTIYDYGTYQSAINFKTGKSVYVNEDDAKDTQLNVNGYNDYSLSFNETQDTINLDEWTFDNLFNSLIKIEPTQRKSAEHYKLSIALTEDIWESILTIDKDWVDPDKWEAEEQVKWTGTTRFYPIKDSANYYYRIPEMDSLTEFEELKKTLNLRDTLVVIPGEYDDVSTVVYKNKPCHFYVKNGIFKIEKYVGTELKDTKYIRIEFSYGC